MGEVHVMDHPLVSDKLTHMRDKNTSSLEFRELLNQITLLMGYEATRDFEIVRKSVETPVSASDFPVLKEDFFTIVPILRAGMGMVDSMLRLLPIAHVGHIGLYRDPETHEPVEYYCKMPIGFENSQVIVVDPMLATGGSSSDAITMLKKRGAKHIRMMNIVAAPQGIETVRSAHPDVDIWVAAIDERLNDEAYIVPGLGDAGDRIYGTI
jgi:uracil phosphoribosyltransferase